MRLTSAGQLLIGETTANGMVDVEQGESAGAIPVARLEQLDQDYAFVNYVGTSAADGSKSISTDTTEDSSPTYKIKIQVNGPNCWLRAYSDHS